MKRVTNNPDTKPKEGGFSVDDLDAYNVRLPRESGDIFSVAPFVVRQGTPKEITEVGLHLRRPGVAGIDAFVGDGFVDFEKHVLRLSLILLPNKYELSLDAARAFLDLVIENAEKLSGRSKLEVL
nr:MAG TPA: hypothetical protein [Caudoviricetes sp.]